MFYLHQNNKDPNFIGPILSIILCLRDLNPSETCKILTSGCLNFAESETLDIVCGKHAPDLLESMSEYKKAMTAKIPTSIDRVKYCKSIDTVPKENLETEMRHKKGEKQTSEPNDLQDITNFTSDGYFNPHLKSRVKKLKMIAMHHTKSLSEER